tara:strand:+ start:151 stop:684 length:534 start_codon:yes stop_codon:yes gene_type:complete
MSFGQLIPKLSLCNVNVSEISVSGNLSFTDGSWDASEACVTVTMSYDLCDQNGNTFASGFSATSQSSGCAKSRSSESTNQDGIYVPVGILGDIEVGDDIKIPMVYPNPSSNVFTLSTVDNLKSSDVLIYNLNGRKISANVNSVSDGISIDLSDQKAGNYIVKFSINGTSFTQQIIKK